MPDVDLLVLGAGPAGIGAAQRAISTGHSVAVLERNPRVGGMAASFEVGGVRVDLGSHRLHRATDPEILAELRRLLDDDLQTRPRRGRIRLAGRWLPFPLSPQALLRLPPAFAARAARDAVTAPLRRPRQDTFGERIRAGLGPTMLARFYGPYARKLWGLAPDEIDGEQARVRVGAASPAALLRRVVRGADPEARTFFYPRRGFGQLSEALAADARAGGAHLELATEVTGIRIETSRVAVTTEDGAVWSAPSVWSTLPLTALARIIHGAPASVTGAAGRLRSRAMVLVYVVLDQPRLTPYDAHYLPEAWTPLTRLSEPKNYRDGTPGVDDPGDPPDRTVLCAEIPCALGDASWSADDRELAGFVEKVLAATRFPPAPIADVNVVRLPSAYPVYERGYARDVSVVADWLDTLPGLLTFGRQGLFVHDNTHHALQMAWAAVDALGDDGRVDPAAWRAARAGFAGHVVED